MRKVMAFNRRDLKRGSLVWLVRGVLRNGFYHARKPLDRLLYHCSNSASLKAAGALQQDARRKAALIETLQTPSLCGDEVIISIIGASRRLGNPNNRLGSLIQSVMDTAYDTARMECIFRIDDDDDLEYYLSIRERFGSQLRIRFVVGERKGGYLGLHQYYVEDVACLAPSSKLVFGIADDCILMREGWDEEFDRAQAICADNILFINTGRNFALPYEDEKAFFRKLWELGPPSLAWVVSRRVVELAAQVAQKHKGWTAFGCTSMADSFVETLQFYLWQITKERRVVTLEGAVAVRLDTIIASYKGGLWNQSPVAIKAFEELVKEESKTIIRDMAQKIAPAMIIRPK